jgi:hypothetical protein
VGIFTYTEGVLPVRTALLTSQVQVDDELAHYTTSTALDDVLAWFAEDGYTMAEIRELVEGRIDSMEEWNS